MSLKKLIDLDLLDRFLDKVKALIPSVATNAPQMDGTAAVGSSTKYAKEDHVHPTDASLVSLDRTGTELVNGTNLTTIKSPGNYYFTGIGTITNAPITTAFKMEVIRTVSGDYDNICQIIFSFNGNANSIQDIYYRYYASNLGTTKWSNWQSISNAATVNNHRVLSDVPIDAYFKNILARTSRESISTGTDLNDIKTVGVYRSTSRVINSPLSDPTYDFTMFVVEGYSSAHGCFQIIFPADGDTNSIYTSDVYFRRYSPYATDPGWSDWVNIRNPELVNSHTVESDVPANAVFTDTTYTPASATPLMDSTAAVGTSEKYAREDHVHPKDSSMLVLDQFGTEFASGDDLDDFITPGNYYTNDAYVPQSLLHRPSQVSNQAFPCKLIVLKVGRANSGNPILYQFYLGGVFSDATIYMRSRATEMVWTEWVCLTEPTTVNGHTVLSDVPANAVFTDTTYTPASSAPGKIASASSTGTSTNYARQDHTHGIDLATGDSDGQVKIAGQNVSVKGLGSLAYADSVTTVNGHTVLSDVPANAVFTDTTYTPASADPLMDGTAAVGTSVKYAREDHIHPRDEKVFSLVKPANTIPESADLDGYYTAGTYLCPSAAIASTLLHAPENDDAFVLVVMELFESSTRTYQFAFINAMHPGVSSATIYFRYHSTVWSDWFDIRNPSSVNGHSVLSDVPANLAFNGLYYGECSTGASTAAKVVTLTNGDGFSLVEGAKICIRFANANSASNPTLNVNDTGAKAVVRFGTTVIGTTAGGTGCWSAGSIVLFVYDGTSWVEHYWNNTTYLSMSVSEYTAGTGTTARLMTAARLKAAIKLHSAPDVYTATIPTTGWTTASYGAYIDVTFTGATFAADDTVFVDLNLSDDTNLQLINDSWACLLRATPTASSAVIRFKFREIPTVAIPVRAVVT